MDLKIDEMRWLLKYQAGILYNIYICARVEGPHSQSNVAATLHSIGKINKVIRAY